MQQHLPSIAPKPSLPNISEAKRALLEKMLRGDAQQQSDSPLKIRPRSSDTPPQLSFAQQRLWFLDQLSPGSAVFNVPLAVRLPASIDPAALERSVNEIVRRHETLRTTFATAAGQPVPIVNPVLEVDLVIRDLTSHADAEREATAHEVLRQEAHRPFDLSKGPLIRATLVRLNPNDHIFLVVMHHIVSDGWSLVLFFRELSALYDRFSRGEQSPLTELQIQYADYVAWQREWLRGDPLQQQLTYWKAQLGGELSVLDLPIDRPRPAEQTFRGAREWLLLPEPLTSSLTTLGQREGATLFMTLLAAFKILLYRYTGQEDVIVGSPIANRPQTETESLIGFFLNNLALRSDLSGDPTFNEVLARVKQTALNAYANQDVPFEKLIEELNPARDLSRTPIFQVYFNLFNFGGGIKLPGTDQSVSFVEAWAQSDEDLSKFDLTLYAGRHDDELKLALVYNTDLFDASSITRMLAHFRALLEGVVANPAARISEVPLRTESESLQHSFGVDRVRPTNAFNEFHREEIEQSIADRFARQVENYPDRIAIKSKDHEWTYQKLDQISDQIAHTLLAQQSNSEQRIALLFEHDAPMIAAMLGALKAGKAYVPLDPHHPQQRLAHVVEHCDASAILTNSKNLALAGEVATGGVQLVNIDATDSTECVSGPTSVSSRTVREGLNRRHSSPAKLPQVKPDSLAYILYTSGSTGQPKGVMQSHRNVLHHIRVYTNTLHLNAEDRLTLLSSYCFDASVMDIYGALLNGATLYPIDIRTDGLAGLAGKLLDEEITIYHSTPTVYRYFISTIKARTDFRKLRLLVLGGEEVKRSDVDSYRKHFSDDCLFVNGLGPTEATVSLQNFIDKQTEITGESLPVGFPVENTEVLLLNGAGKPSEIYGEIAIKSEHVALGYWRNPEATAAAFSSDSRYGTARGSERVSSPTVSGARPSGRATMSVSSESGEGLSRIYRTGDMGRRLPDGRIKFEGRKDFQVKIRGFRIELGEIESALAQHSLVRENVVVARETAAGDKRLVAYVVPREANASINGELRDYLKQKLPEYMVPGSFVVLDSLPLTASGKLDRRALPAPGSSDRSESAFVRPQTALQILLAGIWVDLLDVKEVGIDENFFELGGHSLLAVQLFAQILKRCGKSLPLATLFRAPTVAQLAEELEKGSTSGWSSLVAINPVNAPSPYGRGLRRGFACGTAPTTSLFPGPSPKGRRETVVASDRTAAPDTSQRPPFFCVHALGGNVIEYYDLARHLGDDQPFYGLQSQGLDGRGAAHTRVEEMAAHYIKEMRELQSTGPYFIGGRSLGGMIAFEMARQLRAQGQEVGLLALLDTYPSGYAKLFRDESTMRAALYRASSRIGGHVSNLRSLSTLGKLSYLLKKLKFAPRKMKSQVWRRVYQTYKRFGQPLPRALRDITEFNSLAVRQYVPQVYDGHVTLFWANTDLRASVDFVEGWRALAGGGIDVHEIPGSHLDIVKEPHVGELAKKLDSCLDRAQIKR